MAKRYLLRTDEKGKQALLPWIEKHARRADCRTVTAEEAETWRQVRKKEAAQRREKTQAAAEKAAEVKSVEIELEKITTKKELVEWSKKNLDLEFPDVKDTSLANLKERARDAVLAQVPKG